MTQIKIEKIVYGGEGMGFLDGKVCFVPGALPGETVEVEMVQAKKNFSRARLVGILEVSPKRENPLCPYAADCGGCQYQHIDYAEELKWKEMQVREYLSRNLKIPEEKFKPIQHAPQPYFYRNSVTVHRTADGFAGFFSEDNQRVVRVADCLLADKRLSAVFSAPWTENQEDKTYRLNESGEKVDETWVQPFSVEVGGKKIWTAAKSFFQNNLEVTAKAGSVLSEWVRQAAPHTFIDLYAGVGTFSVLAAEGAKKIVCIEENGYSQAPLKQNLNDLGIPYEVISDRVEKCFPRYFEKQRPEKPFIFLDPARIGVEDSLALFLGRQKNLQGAAYLSCHLGSLARDLALILKGNVLEVDEVIAFDMFPRTKHIEVLVSLRPKTV